MMSPIVEPMPTMLFTAISRAQHQLLDRPLILDDPVVLDLIPEARDPACLAGLGSSSEMRPTLLRAMFAMRSRFTEDRLASAVERGVRQYVIIGAGLDTFPWRQPAYTRNLRIFAVDHPVGWEFTQRRLRERGFEIPANLSYVQVDLLGESIAEKLAAAGFDRAAKTFCSLLGVTQYLDRRKFDELVGFSSNLPKGSELVLSVISPDDELDGIDLEIVSRGAARTAGAGEPWTARLRPKETKELLIGQGFSDLFHLTPEMAQAQYFAGREDKLRAPKWEQMLAASV
jgi:methyltransferase (TIGR00027 family)